MQANISTSSILSQPQLDHNQYIHNSSLSILQHIPKSAIQQKHQYLLKQCSQYRTVIRQLRQQIQWLQVNNNGLMNQSMALKDILNQKKENIMEVNCQLKRANQEINRLQDQTYHMEAVIQQLREQVLGLKNQVRDKSQHIYKLDIQRKQQNKHIQVLIQEKQDIMSRVQNKQTMILTQIQQRMMKMLQPSTIKQKQKSPSPNKQNRNSQNIMLQLIDQMQRLIEKQNQDQKLYNAKIFEKQQLVQKQNQRIFVLQCQLKEATELMEQYEQNSACKESKIKEIQSKMEASLKSAKKNIEHNLENYRNSIDKLLEVLAKTFIEEQLIIIKIKQIMKSNHTEYELDITLNQLKQVLSMSKKSQKSSENYKKQATESEHKLNSLIEDYDTLKLKHISLQRQHQAILEDNRRILKFNQLSRFRMDRNLKGAWRAQKQNISSNCSTQVQSISKLK